MVIVYLIVEITTSDNLEQILVNLVMPLAQNVPEKQQLNVQHVFLLIIFLELHVLQHAQMEPLEIKLTEIV